MGIPALAVVFERVSAAMVIWGASETGGDMMGTRELGCHAQQTACPQSLPTHPVPWYECG